MNRLKIERPQNLDALPELLSEKQMSERFGISLSYLRKSRMNGQIKGQTPAPPYCKIAKRVFYKRADALLWLENLRSIQR
jgi:hypothetical protein